MYVCVDVLFISRENRQADKNTDIQIEIDRREGHHIEKAKNMNQDVSTMRHDVYFSSSVVALKCVVGLKTEIIFGVRWMSCKPC